MLVWRITRAAHTGLDGEGARLHGGRWNSPGVAVVFAASHLSLAALEYLVHIDIEDVPDDLVALGIEVPDEAGELRLTPAELPATWRNVLYSPECREVGDQWIRDGRSLLLRVPSVIIPEEDVLLLNPGHPGAASVRITSERSFAYDPRLLDR